MHSSITLFWCNSFFESRFLYTSKRRWKKQLAHTSEFWRKKIASIFSSLFANRWLMYFLPCQLHVRCFFYIQRFTCKRALKAALCLCFLLFSRACYDIFLALLAYLAWFQCEWFKVLCELKRSFIVCIVSRHFFFIPFVALRFFASFALHILRQALVKGYFMNNPFDCFVCAWKRLLLSNTNKKRGKKIFDQQP